MDFKGIENLIKAMSESNLSSMDIEYNGIAIKMKKKTIKFINRKLYLRNMKKKIEIIL